MACPLCGDGKLIAFAITHPIDGDTRGYDHAAICRTNQCGHYDSDNDACKIVVEIGKQKGQKRAGKVSWLYHNPKAACPADPPMWSVDDELSEKSDGAT